MGIWVAETAETKTATTTAGPEIKAIIMEMITKVLRTTEIITEITTAEVETMGMVTEMETNPYRKG